MHSGSTHHIVGKLVDFWSAESDSEAEAGSATNQASSKAGSATNEASSKANEDEDESWEKKLRLFDDLGKLPVVELFDIRGWEDAEFKVSDVLLNQEMAEIKVRRENVWVWVCGWDGVCVCGGGC